MFHSSVSCLQPGTCVRRLCQLRWPSEPLASASSLSDPQFLSGVVEWGGERIPILLTSLRSRGLLHVELLCPQQLISEGADVIRPLCHSLSGRWRALEPSGKEMEMIRSLSPFVFRLFLFFCG